MLKTARWSYFGFSMSNAHLAASIKALFDAERSARDAHERLVTADPQRVLPELEQAIRGAQSLPAREGDEAALRLIRIAGVLGDMHGPRVVDLLIDILNSKELDARQAAGEALSELAFDRFKEVAQGIERALMRLPDGSAAIAELPYVVADVAEPGVRKLLEQFLAHRDADGVAAAIEVLVEIGDPSALSILEPLAADTRRVQLEDSGGTEGQATIAELVNEARTLLSGDAAG